MSSPSNDELMLAIQALKAQVRVLRSEMDALRGDRLEPPPVPPAPQPKTPLLAPPVDFPSAKLKVPSQAQRWSLSEKFIGEKLLQYAGMVILALGIVFFLIWTAARAAPEVRVLISLGAGAALIFVGHRAQQRRLDEVAIEGLTDYFRTHPGAWERRAALERAIASER